MPQPMLGNPKAANPSAHPFTTDQERLPVDAFWIVTNSALTGNQPVIHIPHATAPTGKVTKALSSSDALLFAGIADTRDVGGTAAAGDSVKVVTRGLVRQVTSSGAITAGQGVQLSAAADGTVVVEGTNNNPIIGFAITTAASNKVDVYLLGSNSASGSSDAINATTLTVSGVTTLNGNVALGNDAAVDTVTVTADVTLASGADLTVNGTLTANGNTALGNNAAADTVTITADTTLASGSDLIWGATNGATVKGVFYSGTISVAVPSITDPDIAKVDVDVSALTFAPAVGDAVIAIPLEALPTACRYQGGWVSATDTVQLVFGSEGGNVTGANKNFGFLFIDLT